jgi:hypothetical protein
MLDQMKEGWSIRVNDPNAALILEEYSGSFHQIKKPENPSLYEQALELLNANVLLQSMTNEIDKMWLQKTKTLDGLQKALDISIWLNSGKGIHSH